MALAATHPKAPQVTGPVGIPLTDEEIELVERHRADWEFAAYDIFGWTPKYAEQAEILESVRVNNETHAVSANGVGKTDITGIVTLLHVILYRGIVITTANTWNQVKTVLWERMKRIASDSPEPLDLKFSNTELKIDDGWFAMGLSTRDEARFAGYHEPRQMVVVEEASGLAQNIYDAIDGVLVGEDDKLFTVGNPITRDCAWYRKVKDAERMKARGGRADVIHIDARDTPNVRTGKNLVPGMVSKRSVDERIVKWGEDDPRTVARIYGQWPAGDATGLIPLHWLERAFNYDRYVASGEAPDLATEAHGQVRAGMDVARFGQDNSVLGLVKGRKLMYLETWRGAPTTKTAGRAVRVLDGKHPNEQVEDRKFPRPASMRIDAIGVGGGPVDIVVEEQAAATLRQKTVIEEWNAGATPSDPSEFMYFRDEAAWLFRMMLDPENGGIDLSVLDADQREEIESQALAMGYTVDRHGRIVIDDKRAVRKRLKKSPDELETLIMAFWDAHVAEVLWEEYAVSGDELADGTTTARDSSAYQPRFGSPIPYGDAAIPTDTGTDADYFYDPAQDL